MRVGGREGGAASLIVARTGAIGRTATDMPEDLAEKLGVAAATCGEVAAAGLPVRGAEGAERPVFVRCGGRAVVAVKGEMSFLDCRLLECRECCLSTSSIELRRDTAGRGEESHAPSPELPGSAEGVAASKGDRVSAERSEASLP